MTNQSFPEFRPGFERIAKQRRDDRSQERIRAHYILERELSDRLRNAPADERSRAFGETYSELFASLPDHPQNLKQLDQTRRLGWELRGLSSLVRPDAKFVEIGCGDGAIAMAVAPSVEQVYGVDVTGSLIDHATAPANFEFLETDGVKIGLADASVDLVYSNQLLEHLAPDDVVTQTREVARILKPGGRYYCITPSRLTGPHDVSAYFDYQATGFHLLEYDYKQARRIFLDAGFSAFSCFISAQGHRVRVPYLMIRGIEAVMDRLPRSVLARLSGMKPVRWVMGLFIIASR